MARQARPDRAARRPLTRERILRAAIALADADGVDAITMRRLGAELGVEAMSLYHHLGSKEAVLTGVVDLLLDEIPVTAPGPDWQAAVRAQAMAGRALFAQHPWAPGLLLRQRTIGAAYLRHVDRVTGILLAGGLSPQLAHTAIHVLDTRILGFSQESVTMPDFGPEIAGILDGSKAHLYPHISDTLGRIRHDEDAEFAFALDLLLEGLDARRREGAVAGP